MRKLVLVIVLALAVPAVAVARPGERGDGTLAVKSATGRIVVKATGTVLGRIDDGQIAITDLTANGSDDILVLGADPRPVVKANGMVVYTGTKMRVRIVGGRYLIDVIGSGITLSGVGKGAYQAWGVSDGLFSTDGSPFRPISTTLSSDSFGS